jgi:hypothetical protein
MSIALDADRTVIARLRLRGRVADPLLMRLRASSALAAAALAPPGLPPAAILVVRRMEDPLPGRLAFRRATMRVPAEWEQAARARMAMLASRALRPARDAVPETAEAVLFADRSELLACLARDWVRGEVARWW